MTKASIVVIGLMGLTGCGGTVGSTPSQSKATPMFADMQVPGFKPTQTITEEDLSVSPLAIEDPCPPAFDSDLKPGVVFKRSISHSFNGTNLSYVATETVLDVQPKAFTFDTLISDFKSDAALSPFKTDRVKQICALTSPKPGVNQLDCVADPQERVEEPFQDAEGKTKLLSADCKQSIDFKKPVLFMKNNFGTYTFENGTIIPVYASQAVFSGTRQCADQPATEIYLRRMVIGTNQVVMPVSRVRCEDRVLFRYASAQLLSGEVVSETKEQILQAPVTTHLIDTQPRKAQRAKPREDLTQVSTPISI